MAQFQKAIELDPNQPRARYFLALAKEQSGQEKGALEDYITLANSAPANEPWQIDVRKQAAGLAKKLGVDLDSPVEGKNRCAGGGRFLWPDHGPNVRCVGPAAGRASANDRRHGGRPRREVAGEPR